MNVLHVLQCDSVLYKVQHVSAGVYNTGLLFGSSSQSSLDPCVPEPPTFSFVSLMEHATDYQTKVPTSYGRDNTSPLLVIFFFPFLLIIQILAKTQCAFLNLQQVVQTVLMTPEVYGLFGWGCRSSMTSWSVFKVSEVSYSQQYPIILSV